MTKEEIIMLRELKEIDILKERIDDLETVILECKALLINVENVKIDNIQFIMTEIDRVMEYNNE